MRRIGPSLVAVGLVVAGLGVVASPAGAAEPRDLVGTWTGDYEYPAGTDEAVSATETLVIETQKGRLLWGSDRYLVDGDEMADPVRGAIARDGRSLTLAEEGGYFLGEIEGPNRIRVWFVRVDDQFTTFEVVLRRSKR